MCMVVLASRFQIQIQHIVWPSTAGLPPPGVPSTFLQAIQIISARRSQEAGEGVASELGISKVKLASMIPKALRTADHLDLCT